MAPRPTNSARIEEAQKLSTKDPAKAEAIYKDVLSKGPGSGEAALREYETALMGLGELYRDSKQPNKLADLVTTSRTTLSSFAKAKTAKLGEDYCCCLQALLIFSSSTAPRSVHRHPSDDRYPNLDHQVMYRMGNIRTPKLPQTEP